MKKGIKLSLIGAMFLGMFILTSWSSGATITNHSGEWKAPASADSKKNPLKGNTVATDKGKKLYKKMCAICHGNKGKGDGMAGASLSPRPSNFTLSKVQSQTDGAIFWKITEGRAPMASYKATLGENERWQLVNFIRTFKK